MSDQLETTNTKAGILICTTHGDKQMVGVDQLENEHGGLVKKAIAARYYIPERSLEDVYVDKKDGTTVLVGYCYKPQDLWFSVYELYFWEKPA